MFVLLLIHWHIKVVVIVFFSPGNYCAFSVDGRRIFSSPFTFLHPPSKEDIFSVFLGKFYNFCYALPDPEVKQHSVFDSNFHQKLVVVGPVDNRPVTDKLHHFGQETKIKK